MVRGTLAAAAAALSMGFLSASPAVAEKVLGEMEGVTIALPDGFACAESVALSLSSGDASTFADVDRMTRVAGQLTALMAFECPEAKNIKLEGRVGNDTVYVALTSERSDWVVMTMTAPGSDPVKPVAPETPATETTKTEGGFLPELPDVGDATEGNVVEGVQSEPEEQEAAAETGAGFENVGREATTEEFCAASNFNGTGFSRGDWLTKLHEGDFAALEGDNPMQVRIYLLKFSEFFGQQYVAADPSCSGVYDPDLAPQFIGDVMGNIMDSPGGIEDAGIAILEDILNMAQDPGGYMQGMVEAEGDIRSAEIDGIRMAKDYGCSTPAFKRLYGNLAAFIRGNDPVCASGWPGVSIACADYAMGQGGGDAVRESCACIATALQTSVADGSVAAWLAENYDHGANLGTVLAKFPGARKQIGACLLE